MSSLEYLVRAACYFLACYGLLLPAWALVSRALPAGTRVGLRLAAVVLGGLAANAIVVQTLGLLGLFKLHYYVLVCLSVGVATTALLRERKLNRSLVRVLVNAVRLWVVEVPFGLGYVAVACVVLLSGHCALVDGVDSLSIPGPPAVEWVQSGTISVLTEWNYPLCWEYQFASNFLVLGSDVLAVVHRLTQVVLLLLLIGELGRRSGLSGGSSRIISWICVLSPVLWGLGFIQGQGALKNDATFAFALLMCVVALDQARRGWRGSILLILFGVFMLLGSKPTGFMYGGMLLAAFVVIAARRHLQALRRRPLAAAALLAGSALFLATPLATQGMNFIKNGNPIYPVQFKLGGFVFFKGRGGASLEGTELLSHVRESAVWNSLLESGEAVVGRELPAVLAMLAVALTGVLWGAVRRFRGPRLPARLGMTFLLLIGCAIIFWLLYTATPWSWGKPGRAMNYVANGLTWRYAMAPLFLSYVIAVGFLSRVLGSRWTGRILAAAFVVTVFFKMDRSLHLWLPVNWSGFTIWCLVLCGFAAGARSCVPRAWSWLRRGQGSRRALTAACLICCFLGTALATRSFVEIRRQILWQPYLMGIWKTVWNEAPPGALIVVNESRARYRYLLYGERFENRIVAVDMDLDGERLRIPKETDYVFIDMRSRRRPEATRICKTLARRGWRIEAYSNNLKWFLFSPPQSSARTSSG